PIPIQALVERDPAMEKVLAQNKAQLPSSSASAQAASSAVASKPVLDQGVYTLSPAGGKLRAVFVPVTTGVTGATDIEVLTGLKQGEEIVTGRYQILRALKSGTVVKRDNTPVTTDTSSS